GHAHLRPRCPRACVWVVMRDVAQAFLPVLGVRFREGKTQAGMPVLQSWRFRLGGEFFTASDAWAVTGALEGIDIVNCGLGCAAVGLRGSPAEAVTPGRE